MNSTSVSPLQRVLLIVGAAMLLPAVIVVAFLFRDFSMRELRAVEAEALEAADLLVVLADTRAEADISALRVLSTSRYFASGDARAGAARALDALNLIPGWNAVTLSNPQTGETVFEVSRSGIIFDQRTAPAHSDPGSMASFEGVVRDGPYCPCVCLNVQVPNFPDFVLTAFIDPQVYQDLLLQEIPQGAVGALVDRDGEFLARSIDYADRVGTPATSYVRGAVAKGGQGIYEGTTFEGLVNYTAYATSTLTGWSGHVAVDNALIDRPRSQATTALIAGALAAILIGSGLFTYVVRDMAARRLEDRRMMELQKAEAISQFTATVVHDFRNILSAVQSGLRLITRQSQEPQTLEHADMIGGALERGSRLANRLLSFAGHNGAEIQDIDLQGLIKDMEYLLQQAAGSRVQLLIDPLPGMAVLRANRDQLELALVNLVVNARDAMNGEGEIVIGAELDDDHVAITVSDNGPGVTPEVKKHLFKPFFTTRHNGSGTGLGLAQVAGMAEQAGGTVTVEDAPQGGARFVLRLRRAEPAGSPTKTAL